MVGGLYLDHKFVKSLWLPCRRCIFAPGVYGQILPHPPCLHRLSPGIKVMLNPFSFTGALQIGDLNKIVTHFRQAINEWALVGRWQRSTQKQRPSVPINQLHLWLAMAPWWPQHVLAYQRSSIFMSLELFYTGVNKKRVQVRITTVICCVSRRLKTDTVIYLRRNATETE